MSEKTEQPTDKKKRDASKEGRSLRSSDLISVLALLAGTLIVYWLFPFPKLFKEMFDATATSFTVPLTDYVLQELKLFITAIVIVLGVMIIATTLPSLIMSRFQLATKVIQFDFNAINPVAGFKQLYNLRGFKDACKALLYLLVFGVASYAFWQTHRGELLMLVRRTPADAVAYSGQLALKLCLSLLGAVAVLVVIDVVLEYLLYLRELKMTREEVKREMREIERSPEVKKEQRRLSNEFISGDMERAVGESNFIVSNPTHIAVGVYINLEISRLPFISLLETEERALAVIACARRLGVPVVRNVRLARRIFNTYKRYTFIKDDLLDDVADVIRWLTDVELSRRAQYLESDPNTEDNAAAKESSSNPHTAHNSADANQQDQRG